MAHVTQSFVDSVTGAELLLPVSPANWQWTEGNAVATVSLHAYGAVHRPGKPTQTSETLRGFFPATGKNYPWQEPGTQPPEYYIEWLTLRCRDGTPVRYIAAASDQIVGVNKMVLISQFVYGQDGGSGDVNYTLELMEYNPPKTPTNIATTVAAISQDREPVPGATPLHTVVKGDTLWALCNRYYGKATVDLCRMVAADNDISNADLIYPGQVISFPPIDTLSGAMSAQSPAATVSRSPTVSNKVKADIRVALEVNATRFLDTLGGGYFDP